MLQGGVQGGARCLQDGVVCQKMNVRDTCLECCLWRFLRRLDLKLTLLSDVEIRCKSQNNIQGVFIAVLR